MRHGLDSQDGPFNFDYRPDVETLQNLGRERRKGSLTEHVFIIYALILRDLQRLHSSNLLGIISELVRPVIIIVAHYFFFIFLRKPMEGGIPVEIFVLAGFSIWFVFNGIWNDAETGIRWTAGATCMKGVTPLHVRAAKTVWRWLLYVSFCLMAALPFRAYGHNFMLPDVPKSCLLFAVTGGLGFGLGIVLERLAVLASVMKNLSKLLSWSLYVTSGLYFSFGSLPPSVAGWFWYNPLLHLIELERGAFDPGYKVDKLNAVYPTAIMVCLLALGTLMHKAIRSRSHD